MTNNSYLSPKEYDFLALNKLVRKEIKDLENFPLTECQQAIINFCYRHINDIIEEECIK